MVITKALKITDIIGSLGGYALAAKRLGKNERTIRYWEENKSIPAKAWKAIIKKSPMKLTPDSLFTAR